MVCILNVMLVSLKSAREFSNGLDDFSRPWGLLRESVVNTCDQITANLCCGHLFQEIYLGSTKV